MLIRQSKNTFIRTTAHYGYVTNQLTRHDRTYNEVGADFLREINREPQEIDDIVHRLLSIYEDIDYNSLKADFLEFVNSLAKDKFIVMGNDIEQLNQEDNDFTYAIDNPKTLITDYSQQTQEKISENTQDFFLEEIQGRPLISSLQFELSSRCNERCIHCYIPNDKKKQGFDMPVEKVKSILDEFASMGGIHVTLSGGEAFLHNNLLDIVEYCRKKDLMISILSNLISLKDEQIPALKEANLSLIQVSLYSMNPEIHDFITTVKGSFEKTKGAIEKLVAADIPVQISCPIMKANRHGYDRVLEYAKSLKIKAQTDYIMMARADLDTSNLANRLSLEETEELLRDIIEHDTQYKDETLEQIPISDQIKFDLERYKKQPVCGVGYDNCCITANGDVYPCAGWQDYVLGNVYKQSLQEIWEKNERVKALRKITQSSFPQCLECEARDYCSRCLVRNYNESNGNMFAVNHHFCDVAFLNKKIVEEYKNKGVI
jgi:radical SAM protein with 4Fe4S-binding SPASM domain